jgi:hypothetical protein
MSLLAIVTYETDLHGHAVKKALESRNGVQVALIPVDSVISNGGVHWSNLPGGDKKVQSITGDWFKPCDFDLIWWRRINQPLVYPGWLTDPVERDFISHEWRAALVGLLNDQFNGIWINDPALDLRAGNKLYQLRLAEESGLRIPKTLVSQQPSDVRAFCRELGGRVVAKKIAGSQLRHTVSVVVTLDQLKDDRAIALCPAIYQEIIPSRRHLRVNCFGERIHSSLIESDVFDWRRDLNVPFSSYNLDPSTKRCLGRLLQLAGLRMGIMDMILTDADELIWLELNPQGQFLFCEALTGDNLTISFTDFLLDEARGRK